MAGIAVRFDSSVKALFAVQLAGHVAENRSGGQDDYDPGRIT